MGDFLQAFFGPILGLIEFCTQCVPHLTVVHRNQRAVKYPGGGEPVLLEPTRWSCPAWLARILLHPRIPGPLRRLALIQGLHWYVPLVDQVAKHHTCADVLNVDPIVVETEDCVAFAAGMVVTYRIADVLSYEVSYMDADESLAELCEGALRKLVLKHTVDELRDHRQPLDDKLANACRAAVEDLGVEVISARLTEQAQVDQVSKVFGVELGLAERSE